MRKVNRGVPKPRSGGSRFSATTNKGGAKKSIPRPAVPLQKKSIPPPRKTVTSAKPPVNANKTGSGTKGAPQHQKPTTTNGRYSTRISSKLSSYSSPVITPSGSLQSFGPPKNSTTHFNMKQRTVRQVVGTTHAPSSYGRTRGKQQQQTAVAPRGTRSSKVNQNPGANNRGTFGASAPTPSRGSNYLPRDRTPLNGRRAASAGQLPPRAPPAGQPDPGARNATLTALQADLATTAALNTSDDALLEHILAFERKLPKKAQEQEAVEPCVPAPMARPPQKQTASLNKQRMEPKANVPNSQPPGPLEQTICAAPETQPTDRPAAPAVRLAPSPHATKPPPPPVSTSTTTSSELEELKKLRQELLYTRQEMERIKSKKEAVERAGALKDEQLIKSQKKMRSMTEEREKLQQTLQKIQDKNKQLENENRALGVMRRDLAYKTKQLERTKLSVRSPTLGKVLPQEANSGGLSGTTSSKSTRGSSETGDVLAQASLKFYFEASSTLKSKNFLVLRKLFYDREGGLRYLLKGNTGQLRQRVHNKLWGSDSAKSHGLQINQRKEMEGTAREYCGASSRQKRETSGNSVGETLAQELFSCLSQVVNENAPCARLLIPLFGFIYEGDVKTVQCALDVLKILLETNKECRAALLSSTHTSGVATAGEQDAPENEAATCEESPLLFSPPSERPIESDVPFEKHPLFAGNSRIVMDPSTRKTWAAKETPVGGTKRKSSSASSSHQLLQTEGKGPQDWFARLTAGPNKRRHSSMTRIHGGFHSPLARALPNSSINKRYSLDTTSVNISTRDRQDQLRPITLSMQRPPASSICKDHCIADFLPFLVQKLNEEANNSSLSCKILHIFCLLTQHCPEGDLKWFKTLLESNALRHLLGKSCTIEQNGLALALLRWLLQSPDLFCAIQNAKSGGSGSTPSAEGSSTQRMVHYQLQHNRANLLPRVVKFLSMGDCHSNEPEEQRFHFNGSDSCETEATCRVWLLKKNAVELLSFVASCCTNGIVVLLRNEAGQGVKLISGLVLLTAGELGRLEAYRTAGEGFDKNTRTPDHMERTNCGGVSVQQHFTLLSETLRLLELLVVHIGSGMGILVKPVRHLFCSTMCKLSTWASFDCLDLSEAKKNEVVAQARYILTKAEQSG